MKPYPYWKVLIGFSLCPGIIGLVLGLYVGISVVIDIAITKGAMEHIDSILWVFFITPIIFVLGAVIFFGAPAFLLAILYALLRVRKKIIDLIFVFICGGLGASVWAMYIWPKPDPGIRSVIDAINGLFSGYFIGYFFLGAISSILMGLYVLPSEVLASDEIDT
jgi:hypothetical protein